jgi:uncharacterized membrane protein YeaQ/YmgE (transglycosylase-associated protein family)
MTTAAPSSTLYCYRHPDRETGLRCNRCERPICAKCAVRTPTGYRCVECVRDQRKVYDNAQWLDYIFAGFIAGFLAYLGSQIVAFIGFFTIFLAPAAGAVIAEAVRYAVRKRRSKLLFQIVVVAVVVGAAPGILIPLLFTLGGGGLGLGFSFSLVWQVLYTFIAATTAYYRLSGIQFSR